MKCMENWLFNVNLLLVKQSLV